MQWWIGQVTDPKKGEWDTSQEKQQGKTVKMFIHIVVVFALLDIMVMMLNYQIKTYHLHMFFYRLAFQPLLVVVKP